MRAFVLVFPALIATGCDDFRTALLGEETLDDPGPLTCADLDGEFTADAIDISAEGDPQLSEDFGDFPDLTVVFDDRSGTFESMLIVDDTAHIRSGSFSVIGERLVLDGPLLPGMGPGPTALGCDYDGVSLTLYGATAYDFAGDDTDEFLDADFVGTLSSL